MILLLAFGLVVILSTDLKLAQEQLLFTLVGLVSYFLVTYTKPEYLRAFAPLFYFFSISLLLGTLLLGTLTHGAVRWLPLGFAGFTIQTSELSKFLLIVSFASFFASSHWLPGLKSFLKSLFLVALPVLLVYRQPDLGTSLVLLTIWLLLLTATGKNLKLLVLVIFLALLLSPLLWQGLKSYQKQRISTFLNPSLDPLGSGYHILQAKIAIGSGQIWGRGFGEGSQSHLKFLPEYHNDFIFATLTEEWGLLGASILLLLYLSLFYKILAVFHRASQPFERLLALGSFALIVSQFTVNVGMNLGLAPVTGIPLPLVSSGGSSLVTTMMVLGLAQSVARNRKLA